MKRLDPAIEDPTDEKDLFRRAYHDSSFCQHQLKTQRIWRKIMLGLILASIVLAGIDIHSGFLGARWWTEIRSALFPVLLPVFLYAWLSTRIAALEAMDSKKPNQSVQPAPPAVTPTAAQEVRQP